MIGYLQSALLPSGFATVLFLSGLVAAVFLRTRRFVYPLFAAAGVVLLVFSNGLVATLLMIPLEYAYPAMQDPQRHPDVQSIVVLTAYAAGDENLPESAKMNASSAFRVLEAMNLRALRPECRIIVSGGPEAATIIGRQLRLLGVPDDQLFVDDLSGNTAASAENLKLLIGDKPLFLVTSAGHMKRAVGVFRKQGLNPIPAPTDYQLPANARYASWTTSPIHLQASDLAAHEYLGLAWYRLTRRI